MKSYKGLTIYKSGSCDLRIDRTRSEGLELEQSRVEAGLGPCQSWAGVGPGWNWAEVGPD